MFQILLFANGDVLKSSLLFRRLQDGMGLHVGIGFKFYEETTRRRKKRQEQMSLPNTIIISFTDFSNQVNHQFRMLTFLTSFRGKDG